MISSQRKNCPLKEDSRGDQMLNSKNNGIMEESEDLGSRDIFSRDRQYILHITAAMLQPHRALSHYFWFCSSPALSHNNILHLQTPNIKGKLCSVTSEGTIRCLQ